MQEEARILRRILRSSMIHRSFRFLRYDYEELIETELRLRPSFGFRNQSRLNSRHCARWHWHRARLHRNRAKEHGIAQEIPDSERDIAEILQGNSQIVQENSDIVLWHPDIIRWHPDIVLWYSDFVQEDIGIVRWNTDNVQENIGIVRWNTDNVQEKADMVQENTDMVQENTDKGKEKQQSKQNSMKERVKNEILQTEQNQNQEGESQSHEKENNQSESAQFGQLRLLNTEQRDYMARGQRTQNAEEKAPTAYQVYARRNEKNSKTFSAILFIYGDLDKNFAKAFTSSMRNCMASNQDIVSLIPQGNFTLESLKTFIENVIELNLPNEIQWKQDINVRLVEFDRKFGESYKFQQRQKQGKGLNTEQVKLIIDMKKQIRKLHFESIIRLIQMKHGNKIERIKNWSDRKFYQALKNLDHDPKFSELLQQIQALI